MTNFILIAIWTWIVLIEEIHLMVPLEFGLNFDVKEIGVNWHGMMIKWGLA